MSDIVADFMSGDYPPSGRASGRLKGDHLTEWIGLTRADIAEVVADAEKRGAAKALRDMGGTLLSLGYADAEAHVIRQADRIASGEVTP